MIKKGVIYSLLVGSIACAPSAEYVVGGGCEYEVARSERAYGKVLQGVSPKEVEHVARILMLVEQGYAWRGLDGRVEYRSRDGRLVGMQMPDLSQKVAECDINEDGVLTKEELEMKVQLMGQGCR